MPTLYSKRRKKCVKARNLDREYSRNSELEGKEKKRKKKKTYTFLDFSSSPSSHPFACRSAAVLFDLESSSPAASVEEYDTDEFGVNGILFSLVPPVSTTLAPLVINPSSTGLIISEDEQDISKAVDKVL